jgi:hypothetical protein
LNADYPTSLKFETEYYQTPGFYNAIDIHNALTIANDNVYLYWGLAWPSCGPESPPISKVCSTSTTPSTRSPPGHIRTAGPTMTPITLSSTIASSSVQATSATTPA